MSTPTTAREGNEAIRRGSDGKKGSRSRESYGTLEMRKNLALGPWSQRESGGWSKASLGTAVPAC